MTLDELLDMSGFNFKCNTKLIRHATNKNDVNKIYQDGFIEEYQGIQKSDIFYWIKDENGRNRKDKCKYIISFLGSYLYKFNKINILDKYKDKLIIDWGNSTKAWCQWLVERSSSEPKEVITLGV